MNANQLPDGWTLAAYIAHNEAIRALEDKFAAERDRRYTEVKNAEEKAIQIKDIGDRDALQLARDIQIYKDEKANELREQINSERGLYATKGDLQAAMEKMEATLRPLVQSDYQSRGKSVGIAMIGGIIATITAISVSIIGIVIAIYLKQ